MKYELNNSLKIKVNDYLKVARHHSSILVCIGKVSFYYYAKEKKLEQEIGNLIAEGAVFSENMIEGNYNSKYRKKLYHVLGYKINNYISESESIENINTYHTLKKYFPNIYNEYLDLLKEN